MCLNKKPITVNDTLPLIPLKILPLTSNPLTPWLLPLPEAVLVMFFPECLLLCCQGWLDVLNQFITLAFHGHSVFGEEPEAAQHQ